MNKKTITLLGFLLSIIFLIVAFSMLDWQEFLNSIREIYLPKVIIAGGIICVVIILHSVRWAFVARVPLEKYKHFWQAVNIGYLGNMIYPARAGEILKISAIHYFTKLPLGRAISSAVIDRMLDVIVIGCFTIFVLWLHSSKIDSSVGAGVIGAFFFITLVFVLLITFIDYIFVFVEQKVLSRRWQLKLQRVILHGLEGVKLFRHTHNMVIVLLLTAIIFSLDYLWMWQIMLAFGLDLPIEAGITVGVFLLISTSLPSAPGYVGIYQVACVLALALYGIDQSLAIAYSVVLQLITFLIIGVQGVLVMLYCGFDLSRQR